MRPTILVVDDQDTIRHFLVRTLEDEDFEVRSAGTGKRAIEICQEHYPDIVLLDLKLPDVDGRRVLEEIKKIAQQTIVIMITAHGDVESAVEAMRLGAFDFIGKPLNIEHLLLSIRKAMDSHRLWMELSHWRRQHQRQYASDFLVGNSANMRRVVEMSEQVARSNTTSVLVEGESGTGKELIAHVIHDQGPRQNAAFMDLNCASLPEELLESELFGHERGAFTDAKTMKNGLLELADGGTLFLDEVGEMPLAIQAKLLRVLEKMIFKRVGGTKDISVDVRIVSATNRDLEEAVAQGIFREDLYYRLKVVPIFIPPLRERGDDVILLAKHFLNEFNQAFGKAFKGLRPETEQAMLRYPWPGNVRELRNTLERAILLEDGEYLEPEHLALSGHGLCEEESSSLVVDLDRALSGDFPDSGLPFEELLKEVERQIIVRASTATGWNQSKTSLLLGMNRDKLRYRMKLYDISEKPPGAEHDHVHR